MFTPVTSYPPRYPKISSNLKKHKRSECPYLHVKNCEGCGKTCACYQKSRKNGKTK